MGTDFGIKGVVLWLAAAASPLLVATSCLPSDQAPDGGDAAADGESDATDWTTYDGLHIYAEKWEVSGQNVVEHTDFGPVDLLQFENALVSSCYLAIVDDKPAEYRHVCDNVNIDEHNPGDGVPPCKYALCRQQLALCAGYKNLGLADALDVTDVEVIPLTIVGTPTYDRGRVYLTHQFHESGNGWRMAQEGHYLRYKVPPQRPGDRTLLYEAALGFFLAAGIHSGMAFQDNCLTPAVNTYRWTDDPPPPSDSNVTLRMLGLSGFQEATIRFDDTVDRVVKNEVAVARLGGALDTAAHQQQMWNGAVNSQLSALRRLYGDLDQDRYPDGLPLATHPLNDAQRRAVALLRASGVDPSDPDTSGEDLANHALQVIDDSLVDLTVQALDRRRADASEDAPLDASHLAALAKTDVNEYLANNGMTYNDFASAAAFLREEGAVLERRAVDASENDAGILVTPTFASPPDNPPLPVRQARHGASFVRTTETYDSLDVGDAQRGAVQAIQYFRDAARIAMANGDVTTAQRNLLGLEVQRADARIGRASVRVQYTDCVSYGENPGCQATVTVVNPPDDWLTTLLVRGEDGRECVGAASKSPCAVASYVLSEATSRDTLTVAGGTTVPSFALSTTATLPFNSEISVFAVRAGARPELVAADHVRDTGGLGAEVPVGGILAETGDTSSARFTALPMAPAYSCDGVLRTFVPPLEQELTTDSDPYESSWLHYLDLADSLATEADTLGRDILTRSLEMDMRAEAAQGDLRDICGDVGAVPSGDLTGSTAEACFSGPDNATKTVSLGGPLCYWQRHGVQCLCDGEDYREPGSPRGSSYTICDVPCPLPAGRGFDDDPDADDAQLASECEDRFQNYFLGGTFSWPTGDSSSDYQFGYLRKANSLHVFSDPSNLGGGNAGPDCGTVRRLRCQAEQIAHWMNGLGSSTWPSAWPEGDPVCTAPERDETCPAAGSAPDVTDVTNCMNAADNTLLDITLQPWMTLGRLDVAASSLRIAFRPFHNYVIFGGGGLLWSTFDADDTHGCPATLPFRYVPAGQALPEANDFCYVSPTLSADDWWCEQYGQPSDTGMALQRMTWGDQMVAAVTAAKWWGGYRYSPNISISTHDDFGDIRSSGAFEDYPQLQKITLNGKPNVLGTPYLLPSSPSCAYDGMTRALELAQNGLPAGENLVGFAMTEETLPHGRWLEIKPPTDEPFSGPEAESVSLAQKRFSIQRPDDYQKIDGLDLLCYLASTGIDCDNFDPNMLPPVESPEDLPALRRYIECGAASIQRAASLIVIPQVPAQLVDGFRRGGTVSYFPGVQGKKLDAYLAIDSAFAKFRSEADQIPSILFQVAQRLDLYSSSVQRDEIENEIADLQVTIACIQTAMSAAASSSSGFGLNLASGFSNTAVQAAGATAIEVLYGKISDLQSRATDLAVAGETASMMSDIGRLLDQLAQVTASIGDNFRAMQSGLGQLASLLDQARYDAARASFEVSNDADVTYRINEAMRNWLATDRFRYEQLLDQAKRSAFWARRAIEFRLGVDMKEDMTRDMSLVPAPSGWVDDVCTMKGINYDDLSGRTRLATLPDGGASDGESGDAALDAIGTAGWDQWNGHFVGGYISDYVRMLRLFVESYPADRPFRDGQDTVVLSLRDDLNVGVFDLCRGTARNLLLYTDALGSSASTGEALGWLPTDAVCGSPPIGDTSGCISLGSGGMTLPTDVGAAPISVPVARIVVPDATGESTPVLTVADAPDKLSWPGYSQSVTGLEAGHDYALTWYAAGDTLFDTEETGLSYSVVVLPQGGSEAIAELDENPSGFGHRTGVGFRLPDGVSGVEVVVFPSNTKNVVTDVVTPGTLLFGRMQLESSDGIVSTDGLSGASLLAFVEDYQAVSASRYVGLSPCPDRTGDSFRKRFERQCYCAGSHGGVCTPEQITAGAEQCAWEAKFAITMDGFERQSERYSTPMAIWNTNYRWESLGLNLVGTNVRACDPDTSPDSCYGAAFAPYTLDQDGVVDVRNRDFAVRTFNLPDGRIEHAKALAAEVVLTNPPTSSHEALMAPYLKSELRGRPLTGNYTVRIWDTPELDWSKVEDVQFLVNYRYWTPTE